MTPPQTMYPHESILTPIVIFALGFGLFFYRFVFEFLYPQDPYVSTSALCSTQSSVIPMGFNWLVIFGLALMVLAVTILVFRMSEDTPTDIEKQIKQHEDAIVKLKRLKK